MHGDLPMVPRVHRHESLRRVANEALTAYFSRFRPRAVVIDGGVD
jgi:hypothetical protein